MTDFGRGGKVALSCNHEATTEQVVSVDTDAFEKVLEKLKKIILIAAENRIDIPDVSYFAIVPQEGGKNVTVDIVIGDLDHISFHSPSEADYPNSANRFSAQQFLTDCILSRVSDASNRVELEELVAKWSEDVKEEGEKLTKGTQ